MPPVEDERVREALARLAEAPSFDTDAELAAVRRTGRRRLARRRAARSVVGGLVATLVVAASSLLLPGGAGQEEATAPRPGPVATGRPETSPTVAPEVRRGGAPATGRRPANYA